MLVLGVRMTMAMMVMMMLMAWAVNLFELAVVAEVWIVLVVVE